MNNESGKNKSYDSVDRITKITNVEGAVDNAVDNAVDVVEVERKKLYNADLNRIQEEMEIELIRHNVKIMNKNFDMMAKRSKH